MTILLNTVKVKTKNKCIKKNVRISYISPFGESISKLNYLNLKWR